MAWKHLQRINFLKFHHNKAWLIQHFYCSTVIGAVISCANYLSEFVTTTMQLSLRFWKVYTFYVYARILKDSKWKKVKPRILHIYHTTTSKKFFHHHGPLHLQVPFSEQEPFYLSEFQPQSSHLLDAAQSNSLENGKHDIKMHIDKLHVQLQITLRCLSNTQLFLFINCPTLTKKNCSNTAFNLNSSHKVKEIVSKNC